MRFAAILSLFGSFAPDVRPQEESPNPAKRPAHASSSKQDDVVDLPPVVVTPTREVERADRVAQSASVVDDEKQRRLAPQNTPDALKEEPGLVIQQSNQGGGSPVLRGRSGKDVLLLIDGQRFSNSTFRRNHQYLNTIDLFAVESIEVARGPASVPYGSDAMGGAINLTLKRPELSGHDRFGGRLHLQYDTVNQGIVTHADAQAEVGGFAALAGVTTRNFDDLAAGRVGGNPIDSVDVDGKQVPTAYRERAVNFALGQRLTEHDTVDLAFLQSRQWNVPTSERVIANDEQPVPPDLVREVDPQRLTWWELRFRHENEGEFLSAFEAIASLNAPDEERHRVRASAPTQLIVERDEVTAPGVSLKAVLAPVDSHEVIVGAEAYFETVQSESNTFDQTTGIWTENASGRYPDGARYDTFGVYALDRWMLADDWEWTNGVRYSRISTDLDFEGLTVGTAGPFGAFSETWNDVTFATGLTWSLSEQDSLYGSISRGFRAPNLDDLAVVGDFSAGNRVPNFDVDPEVVWNFELGARRVDERTNGGAALSFAYYQDLLTNQFAFSQGGTNFFVVDNADRATIWSLETWLDRRVVDADPLGLAHYFEFQGLANLGRNRSANEPVSKVPPPEALLGWRVGPARDRTPRRGDARALDYFGELFARGALAQRRLAEVDELDPRFPDEGTPAWWTLNVRVGVEVARGLWLTTGVENLFNYRYRVHGSGIDAPGRNFTIAADYVF